MNERIDIKLIRSLSQKKYRDETGLKEKRWFRRR